MAEYSQIPSDENEIISNNNAKIQKNKTKFNGVYLKRFFKFLIIFIPFLLFYLYFKQHKNIKIDNILKSFQLPSASQIIINRNLIISKVILRIKKIILLGIYNYFFIFNLFKGRI